MSFRTSHRQTGLLHLLARFALPLLLAATIAAGGPPRTAGAAAPSAVPNFVVIMADDLGYGDLSCYGGWIKTPHLDALAAGGMRFTDFHSSGNVCSPTRAGLLTGRYQQRAGIPGVVFADPSRESHHHGLQPEETTFAELLRDVGYATAIFGKWHLGYSPRYNPIHHGFQEFRGYVSGNVDFFSHVDQAGNYDWWHQDQHAQEAGYTTHLITRHAVRFIQQHRDRPFCLYLPHEAPHYPYQGPGDTAERQVGLVRKTQGRRQDVRQAYAEMVQAMDQGVGQVVETLKQLDLQRNTLVLFCSDNGANRNGSNGPLRGAKGSDWEGGHRVPAIASWPGRIQPGTVSDQPAITLDVMPTLLALARVPAPKERPLDGIDLSPLLLDGKSLPPRPLFWNGRAMRDGPWKLIVRGSGPGGPNQEGPNQEDPGLYRLDRDLGETRNLAARHPDRVQAMRAALDAWQRDVHRGATRQPGPTITAP